MKREELVQLQSQLQTLNSRLPELLNQFTGTKNGLAGSAGSAGSSVSRGSSGSSVSASPAATERDANSEFFYDVAREVYRWRAEIMSFISHYEQLKPGMQELIDREAGRPTTNTEPVSTESGENAAAAGIDDAWGIGNVGGDPQGTGQDDSNDLFNLNDYGDNSLWGDIDTDFRNN